MAVYSANAVQTVNPGESVIFTATNEPCRFGFIRHRDETGSFLLSGRTNCCRKQSVPYFVDFGANIAVATGGTVGPISLGIAVDGANVPASEMIVTPAAVEEFFNVSREIMVDIWAGCCESVSIRNLSDQPILVQNATVDISRN